MLVRNLGWIFGGFIATSLAAKDPDIEAAVAAYEAKSYDEAFQSLEAAKARRGERPAISFDLGLVHFARGETEAAQKSFERATEAEDPTLRASAHFELGNLAFDAQDWPLAIQNYTDCLKSLPTHEDAKWNLELALAEQKAAQEEQEKNKDEQDSSDEDEESSTDENAENSTQSEENSEGNSDENSSGEDSNSTQNDEGSSGDNSSDGQSNENASDGQNDSSDGASNQAQNNPSDGDDASSSAEEKPEEQGQEDKQEQKDESSAPDKQPENAPPTPIERANLDKALEELDRADAFKFGVPRTSRRPVEKDW